MTRWCLPLVAAAALLWPCRPVRAQEESTPQADSNEVVPGTLDSLGDTARAEPRKSPGTAVLLSLLLPGGGQVYAGQWWRAAIIAPAEVTLGYLSWREHREVVRWDALRRSDALIEDARSEYHRHRDRRAALLWWTGAVLAFSMADAYVSALMYRFEEQMAFPVEQAWLKLGPGRVGIEVGF